jgi:hypothetical protein
MGVSVSEPVRASAIVHPLGRGHHDPIITQLDGDNDYVCLITTTGPCAVLSATEEVSMNNNNDALDARALRVDQLRSIASDLTEVHSLLSLLCTELGGGGIVKARHLEPVIADAVPRLQHAVAAMNAMAAGVTTRADAPGPEHNPLLM